MKRGVGCVSVLGWLLISGFWRAPTVSAIDTGPFDGQYFRGVIAYSCDGNFNDPDDWAASPMALAILAAAGLQDKLVHFHYNSILVSSSPAWETEHGLSVLGAAERFSFDRSRFFDCQRQREAAIEHLKNVIDATSPDRPLYLILAGPVDVPLAALRQANPDKRAFVYCISHSRWNDGFAKDFPFTSTKRDVIELGVKWVQVPDQNSRLSTVPYRSVSLQKSPIDAKWAPAASDDYRAYFWLRDANDPKLRFLWERMVASTRPDPSDAGMVYFLVTGDVEATPEKIRDLLVDGKREVLAAREAIRLESENFRILDGFEVQSTSDGGVSHRLCVIPKSQRTVGKLATVFDEPYITSEGRYDVLVRYALDVTEAATLDFHVSGTKVAEEALPPTTGWGVEIIPGVRVKQGDRLVLNLSGALPRIDYVELRVASTRMEKNTAGEEPTVKPQDKVAVSAHPRFTATGPLDDPKAMPGQVIVANGRPGYLKTNGGRPLFLCGPDNPEDFLYLGEERPDGTRNGPQMEIIDFLGRAGVNAFHFMMFRMQRCNIKNEGDDSHSPFIDHDPTKPLNEKILDQWELWLTELEKRGIVVHFEFYNDATDVEQIGWALDEQGNLHPDEARFITEIVKRFMHHKNILWGLEESSNKLPRSRVVHFQKMAELIRQVDHYRHPIVQSLVTPETAEKDIHPDLVSSADYRSDPHIDIVTWLHIPPWGNDFEAQYRAYMDYAWRDRDRFIAMRNETEYHQIDRTIARIHNWACALAGMHALEAQLNAARADRRDRILDAGHVVTFMEQTDWFRMRPANQLAAGETKWVLADPGQSYILYSYDCRQRLGLNALPKGRYEILWFDPISGKSVRQVVNQEQEGPARWQKPAGFPSEVAAYLHRAE